MPDCGLGHQDCRLHHPDERKPPDVLKRTFSGDIDIRNDPVVGEQIQAFLCQHQARSVVVTSTGIPADLVEVIRPDDARDRYLSEDELRKLKQALDEKKFRKGTNDLNQTIHRMRLIDLIAVTTGMRSSEIWGLLWSDIMHSEGLIAVRAKLKGGKMRYVPMPSELAWEMQEFGVAANDNVRVFPLKKGTVGERRRLEGSFDDLLERAGIREFRFHDLRHTFASWYMMNGGDLYELAKILGHSNIKMTERYAKLGRAHIAKTA